MHHFKVAIKRNRIPSKKYLRENLWLNNGEKPKITISLKSNPQMFTSTETPK